MPAHLMSWRMLAAALSGFWLCAVRPVDSAAQKRDSSQTVVVNADSLHAELNRDGRPEIFASGEAIRVGKGRAVELSVVGRNSALFACTQTSEAVPDPDRAALTTWLAGLKDYLPVLAVAVSGAGDLKAAFTGSAGELARALSALNNRVTGPGGLLAVRLRQLLTIELLRASGSNAKAIESAAEAYKASMESDCLNGSCLSAAPLLVDLELIRAAAAQLRQAGALNDTTKALLEAADATLSSSDALRSLALVVGVWHQRILTASTTLPCGKFSVSGDSGRKLLLTVAPIDAPELAEMDLAKEGLTFGFTASAGRPFRVRASLAFLMAPRAIFPAFGASEDTLGTAVIVETGEQDLRYNYGLTLGLEFPLGAGGVIRDQNRVSLWAPELTIVPSDNVRAVGVGAGLSWRIVKFGVGALWARHVVLAPGAAVGATIPSTEALKVRSSFGAPSLYLSVALMGLPPFSP